MNGILRTLSLTQGGEIFRSLGIDCEPAVAVRSLLNLARNCHVSSLIPSHVIHWVFNCEYSYIFKMTLFCVNMFMCVHECEGQRITYRHWIFSFWVSGIELRSLGLVASAFTDLTIALAPSGLILTLALGNSTGSAPLWQLPAMPTPY